MALSPWPTDTSTDAWEAAIRQLASSLGRAVPLAVLDDSSTPEDEAEEAKAAFRTNPLILRIHRIAGMVSARIEKEVPGAPDVVKDEALVRGCGYLFEAGSGALKSNQVDVLRKSFNSNARWFSLSGASSILSPWRAPRGGVIG